MKTYQQFLEGYVASADRKAGKDGKMRPAKHIKTNAKDEDEDEIVEKLDLAKADMGDVIKDFRKSDAPQFQGKSDKKKQQMAIAAKLQADDASKNEELTGNQHKLDKNKNGKLDATDFKKLRKEEVMDEEMTPAQKAARLALIRKTAAKLNKRAERDAKKAMRGDPQLGKRKKDPADIDESLIHESQAAAKELRTYADKHGGIDKKDFHTAADHMEKGNHAALKKHVAGMDTDPRDKVKSIMNKHMKESTDAYGKSMDAIADKKKTDAMTSSDKDKLGKLAAMMAKEKKPTKESYIKENDEMEKKEMMKTQLHFIKYAADEIMEFIDMGGEIEEWYQNKVSKTYSEFESLHSYMEGTARKEGLKEANAENKLKKNTMDASRGARYKLNNPVPERDPKKHKTPQAFNKAVGRALRNEEEKPPFDGPYKKKSEPAKNSDGSSQSPASRVKHLAKMAAKHAEKTVAQHKEGVEFDSEGNLLEAKNKISFHQFMGATKKKAEKKGGDQKAPEEI